jgi:hypothetical protein
MSKVLEGDLEGVIRKADMTESMWVVFRKHIDFFDSENEEYLLTFLLSHSLFVFRERLAYTQNLNSDQLSISNHTYLDLIIIFRIARTIAGLSQSINTINTSLIQTVFHDHHLLNQRESEFMHSAVILGFKVFDHDVKAMIKDYIKGHILTKSGEPQDSQVVRRLKKEERKKDIVKNYSCKKAVYENCRMLAPDGMCLSNCDRKKA